MSDKKSKKELILRAALKLFSQKGFHATTTKEIAKECGVAEGLIFYHFGDKRKLLLYLVNHFSFAMRLQEEDDLLSKLPLEEALVHFGMKYLHFLKENFDYLMLIWSPEMIQDEAISQEVLHLIQNIGTIGGGALNHVIAGEQGGEAANRVAMMSLTSSIHVYFMIRSRFGADVLKLEEEIYVRELVRMLLHGLVKQQ